MSAILVTGAAGFIGFHVAQRLLDSGLQVVGVDSLNDYYDPQLKRDRLAQLNDRDGFEFTQLNLADAAAVNELFSAQRCSRIVHMAAQAGVRYSLDHPASYIESNLIGFSNLLEGCRQHGIEHLVYASSSSVYGANTSLPFSVADPVNHPVSLYGATKKANELMAHSYSHLFGIPTTGLRLFTVYGPWGRPDMAAFLFTRAILEGQPIQLFNQGQMRRSFTFVDDVVEGIVRLLDQPPAPDPGWQADSPNPASSQAPYRIYNLGSSKSVKLSCFVKLLETLLGRTAERQLEPLQPGDVVETAADSSALQQAIDYQPQTTLQDGLRAFLQWYGQYYEIEGIPVSE